SAPARTFAFPIRKRTFLIEYIPPIRKDKKGGQEKGTEGSPIYGRCKGEKGAEIAHIWSMQKGGETSPSPFSEGETGVAPEPENDIPQPPLKGGGEMGEIDGKKANSF
ncbi:MAG: hypothetical protein IIU04_08495, partial [Bacteroidales bacterium]|nr:hypothetical protein [Bacteroidales bacterium]